MSPYPPALLGISPIRFCIWSLLPLLVAWESFRRFLLGFPSLVRTFICLISLSFGLSQSRLLVLCPVPFLSDPYVIFLAISLMNSFCVRSVLFVIILPRSLFVSPRTPSRSLSKNALSFFIRDVIAEAYSASGSPLPSVPCSSFHPSGSSCSSSFLRAHGVCGVAASLAFLRNAPLPSVLEAATWSSSSVFTSFYLKDVQFSSSSGYSLGPVVAPGSVV